MKNIVVLVPSLTIGGREKIAINTYNILKEKYNVFFVVFNRVKIEYAFNDNIYYLNVPASKNKIIKFGHQIIRVLKLKSFCKKNNINCIFSLGEAANITNVLLKKIYNIKSICAIHCYNELKNNRLMKYVYNNSDILISISQDMKKYLLELCPNLRNVYVIENGYDFNKELKNRINYNFYDENKPKLISMGRFENQKRFDRLIKAFAIVLKKYPEAELSILGKGSLLDNMKRLAKNLSIENKVHFLGYKEDPFEELLKNDIYVLSSHHEGFPNCLIEALASGLAIVSLDCPTGPREILSNEYYPLPIKNIVFEKYGVLVENNEGKSIELLAKGILSLLNDKDKVNYYKNIATNRSKCFSLEIYKEKILSVCKNDKIIN